jgi:soluble lytic murein transglycosylase-like protein
MVCSIQTVAMVLLSWLVVILFSAPAGNPPAESMRSPAKPADQLAGIIQPLGPEGWVVPDPPQKLTQPEAELARLEEAAPSIKIREGAGSPYRAPAQIANLMKRKYLEEVIEKYAKKYGVDEDLIWAVVRQESGFNPHAVSPKGAMGLMQLMPGTAALMGVSDPFDVEQNIAGGVKYLEQCLNQFNQSVPLALAAYNAGPGNVVKYQGCPPFAETRNYVLTILQAYAGESIRADLKLASFSTVAIESLMVEEPPGSDNPRGLPWRVPLPTWKIMTPQCKLGTPRWKVAVRPF